MAGIAHLAQPALRADAGAVRHWLHEHGWEPGINATVTAEKVSALVYVDDRAWRFTGTFPTADEIHAARPWNRPVSISVGEN